MSQKCSESRTRIIFLIERFRTTFTLSANGKKLDFFRLPFSRSWNNVKIFVFFVSRRYIFIFLLHLLKDKKKCERNQRFAVNVVLSLSNIMWVHQKNICTHHEYFYQLPPNRCGEFSKTGTI